MESANLRHCQTVEEAQIRSAVAQPLP